MAEFDQLWVYLSGSPLLSLLLTLMVFVLAVRINSALGGTPLVHPVTLSIAILIGLLMLVDMDYATYFEGAQFIHFLLGPATVALAIPLYDHRERVRRLLVPLLIACMTGIVTAVASTLGLAMAMGARPETVLSLAPRSVTSPKWQKWQRTPTSQISSQSRLRKSTLSSTACSIRLCWASVICSTSLW
ncbi:MAG: LrgB family protein [Halomonas sp.]|nr:LrgB family protein [Halomonas sp.]